MTRGLAGVVGACLLLAAPAWAGRPVHVSEPSVPTVTPAVRDLPEWEQNPFLFGLEMKKREDFSFMPVVYPITPRVDPLLGLQEEEASYSRFLEGFSTLIHDYAGQSTSSSPPDATGDVGPNHFVQAVNQSVSTVRVLDKATGAILRTFTMQSLASGAPCSSGFCDPIVIYDQFADRWMIAELPSSGGNICIYVSTSPDPLGTWYAYTFPVETSLPDFPKFGLWPQGGNGGSYLMGVNAGTSTVRDLFAFDRAKMLAGLPATFQEFTVPRMPNLGFQLVLPASVEGSAPPPDGEPAVFMRHHDDEALNGTTTAGDVLDWWTLRVDWNTPANSLLTLETPLPIVDYDLTLCGIGSAWACMPQPGTSQRLDPVREPLHFPLVYRNFGDYQVMVGTFPTDVDGTDHAALRWFELRKTGASGWTVYQEGVVGGEAGVHRSIGSIAMDQSGNIAIGYTRTGNVAPYYPSIYYKGRLASDPPGTMPHGEYVIVDASTSKTNNERWGDYAGMSVDPADDCTFWFTTEYGGSGATRVAAFKFDACGCLAVPAAPTAAASAPQDNRITVTWDDSATDTITEYRLFRATVAGGPYTEIAVVTDSSPGVPGGAPYAFNDDTVSGGTTYHYVVRSTDGAACTSPASAEVSALATGACTLAPAFAGLTAVTNPGNTTCTLQLSWTAASSACSGPVAYNVYRSTSASFVPAPENRVAAGVTGTDYTDSVELTGFTRYHYVVRAVDGINAVEEGNTVRKNAVPTGTITATDLADTFEGAQSGGGFDLSGWTKNSIAGTTNWVWSTARFFDGTHSWFAQDVAGVNDKVLVSPIFGVGPGTVLTFRHTYQFEGSLTSCYDGGTLEASTDGGASWTVVPAAVFGGGGYTGTINSGFSNPIGGKPGWCSGALGALSLVTVNLGTDASLVNREVKVRWHEGDDTIISSQGWYVDSFSVTNAQTADACSTAFSCAGVANCSGHGACVAPDTCACETGWSGADCSLPNCAGVNGCSGHGLCTAPDTCACETGWSGVDCSLPSCAGVNGCSGHGLCTAPDTCACESGWSGADCSVPEGAAAGRVSGLQVDRNDPSVVLTWGGSCLGTDSDYAVYEGTLGDFGSHVARACSTSGATSATFEPPVGSVYWLVVPRNGVFEGSYGKDSQGNERPAAGSACLPASVAVCP